MASFGRFGGLRRPIAVGRGCFLLVKGRGGFPWGPEQEGEVPSGEGGAGTDRSRSGSGRPTEGGAGATAQPARQLARERRIDEASVDVEVAWEDRAPARGR